MEKSWLKLFEHGDLITIFYVVKKYFLKIFIFSYSTDRFSKNTIDFGVHECSLDPYRVSQGPNTWDVVENRSVESEKIKIPKKYFFTILKKYISYVLSNGFV